MALSFAVIYPVAADVLSQLENIRRVIVFGKIASFVNIATALAAILCAFALLKVSNDYLEGRGVTMYQVIRPLMIFVLCADFTTIVANPLHSVVTVFTKQMSESVNMSESQYEIALSDNLWRSIMNSPNYIAESTLNAYDGVKDKDNTTETKMDHVIDMIDSPILRKGAEFLKGMVMAVLDYSQEFRQAMAATGGALLGGVKMILYLTFLKLVMPILFFLAKFLYLANQVMCYFYLIVYMLIGPFVFAIGILEPFKNGIVMWIARYVQTCFWIPVGQLVMWINYKLLVEMTNVTSGFSGGADFVNVCILIVSIFNIISIPTLAATIIESSGTGGAEDRVKGGVKEGISLIARALI